MKPSQPEASLVWSGKDDRPAHTTWQTVAQMMEWEQTGERITLYKILENP